MTDRSRQNPANPVRIVHLEDSALDGELAAEFILGEGLPCAIERVSTPAEFEAAIRDPDVRLILADHQLPGFDGMAALAMARDIVPDVPFVFLSGTMGEEIAVEALRNGATDFVVKQRLGRLGTVIRRALAEAEQRRERARAEAALNLSEASFATLVNAMPQLCWIAGADGRVAWSNRRWHEYTGDDGASGGWDRPEFHHPEHAERVLSRWRRSLASGEPFEATSPLRAADGSHRVFLTRAEPVRDADARPVRWLGTCTDISAQQAAEEALRSLNQTLEVRVVEAIAEREAMLDKLHETQRLETIGELTGGVAHDFNNLLTPIIGSLDLLQRRRLDDRMTRHVRSALQAADRARLLVQRLLAFARRQVLEPRSVDVVDLIQGMVDLIQRSLGGQIRLTVDAEERLIARVDPTQLELAILNLSVNARDAMPSGGELRIEVSGRTVGSGRAGGLRYGDYVVVAVVDTGTGMDDDTLKRAIEPFFSTKGIGKGTGLGLSMVHGLAAQSGGALILSSAPGRGTRAEVWLPAAAEAAPGTVDQFPGAFQPDARRAVRVLVVDDEMLVRAATADMLADHGFEVVEAGSADEALSLVSDGLQPGLVVTDYLMPGRNGEELARAIRQIDPEIPVLLVTGYASLTGNSMLDLPLLSKPFTQNELVGTVRRLLGGGGETRGVPPDEAARLSG